MTTGQPTAVSSDLLRVPQDVASPPDRLDVVPSAGRLHELFAKLTNKHVDDLLAWLVHSAVEVAQEHILRDRGPLPHREQFKHPVLLRRKADITSTHFGPLLIQLQSQIATADHRLHPIP